MTRSHATRDYISRRINLEQQRKAHLREAPRGCLCIWCLGPAGVQKALDEILAAQAERNGEAPF